MKKLLLFLIFPYVSYSQNIDKEEAYRIYKCCLSYYQNDTSKNTFIKESTVYYKISDSPNKLNKIVFGVYKPDYLIDSVYNILFENYLHSDTNSINLSFLSDKDQKLKIFNKKDEYKISKGKKYWQSKMWEKYKKVYDKNGELIELSKIFTSVDHKYAIVYMGVKSKELGIGFLFLCINENKKWSVKYNPILWIRTSDWTN